MESQIPDPDRSRDRDPRPETSIVNLKFPGRPKAVLGERFWRDINVRGGVIAVNACDSWSWEVVIQIWVGMGKGECKGKGRMKMKIGMKRCGEGNGSRRGERGGAVSSIRCEIER